MIHRRHSTGRHRGIGRRSLVLLASAVIGLVLLVPGPAVLAAPNGGLFYPPARVKNLPDNSATGTGVTAGTAKCPDSHKHPVGGGVQIEGVDPELDLEVHATGPDGQKWRAAGNNDAGVTATMTIYVICSKGDMVTKTKTRTIGPDNTGSATAQCPAGTRVTGGGAEIVGGNHSDEVTSTEPVDGSDANNKRDDAWFGSAGNGSGGSAVTLRVTAICASTGTYKTIASPPMQIPHDSQATTSAMCPANTLLTGGGTDIDGQSSDLELADGYPIDGPDLDVVTDDGWTSTANNEKQQVHFMQVFAVCKVV